MAIGLAFAWGSGNYDIGSADQMGPGYVPRMLGVLTTFTGALIALKAVLVKTDESGRIGAWAWKPLVLIISANLVFGAMIGGLPSINLPPMGLVLGVYSLVFISSLASQEFRFREVLSLSTVLAVAVYLICIKLLNLYLPLWPSFMIG
jgi:hypothetical protein